MLAAMKFAPTPGTHRHRVQAAISGHGFRVAGGDCDQRWLSGVAAFGDRDGVRVASLIGDPSRRVRGVAIAASPIACDDALATAALRTAWSLRGERTLLRRMSRHHRTAAIDAFLDGLAADRQLRDLVDDLPFGSQACVRRHMAHALDRPSARWWAGLALGHPALLAEILDERWRALAGEADPVTRQLTDRYHPRIAERAPAAGLALAEVLLGRGIQPDRRVWSELLRRLPEACVELAIRHAAAGLAQPESAAARVPTAIFARRFKLLSPTLLARIVGHAPHLLGDFGPEVSKLSADRRSALAEGWRDVSERFPSYGAYLLRWLPADAQREAAYQRWSLAARDRDGAIGAHLVRALPLDLAAREARRHAHQVVALEISPQARFAGIARFMPWAELEVSLKDHLGHPDGTMRALALAELLANPGEYVDEPALVDRALELVAARKFEQDPVRQVMFATLARWPRRVWQASHLPAVARAVRDALDASDLSPGTAAAVEQVIVRLFGVDSKWAARWLATTIKERGQLFDANLGRKLSDDDIKQAAPELLAIARTWTTQERAPWLVSFASGLGPRLRLIAGLGELLVQARTATPWEWVATQLTEVLARYDPERHAATLAATIARFRDRNWPNAVFHLARIHGLTGRQKERVRDRRRPPLPASLSDALAAIAGELDQRYAPTALHWLRRRDPQAFDRVVGEVVRADESVVVVGDVTRWLHRHRQDLLAPYLADRAIRGRWATGKTRWVLPYRDGFFRWTPQHAEAFARALVSIVSDRERDTPTVLTALTILPAIEYADMGSLCRFAADDRPVVVEKTVRVLARCDAAQGVPTLLNCLEDARARFAIYGLRRALFGMIPDRALALLADVPMKKVTVAKEVVRLTGELRAAGAFGRLQTLAAETLHRDVRIALLRALWDHLDREDTWAVYERAVNDRDWVVASRLADIPANRLTRQLDARLSQLLARVLARPEPEARMDLLRRLRSIELVDAPRALLDAARGRLRSPFDDETAAAVAAIMQRATESDLGAVTASLDALRSDPRNLHIAVRAIASYDLRARANWQRIGDVAAHVALRDPRWSTLAIEVVAACCDARAVVTILDHAPLDVDAMVAARTAIERLPDDDLDDTLAVLAASQRPELRRIAVWTLERAARPGRGWTPDRLGYLARLRDDPNPAVAGAAARVWPPREQD